MKKKIVIIAISVCVAAIIGLGVCYGIVSSNASGRTYNNVEDVPVMEYGLLLGTSPITRNGAHNYYFDNRIKAAAELFHAGKVKKIIASGGDYSGKETYGCNELEAMRDSLEARGVPARSVLLDYEGIRTINSIVKAKELMGVDSCIIISQEYHNQRAIWQADHLGLKAVAYNAAPSDKLLNRIRNIAREVLARPKMYLDLWLGSKPIVNNNVVNAEASLQQINATLFSVKVHGTELDVLKQLEKAGIIKVEDLRHDNGLFQNAIIEFGGVKFGMNSNFVFITGRPNLTALHSLIAEISKYYGSPEIDAEVDAPHYRYYWRNGLEGPTVKIHPLHTDDKNGGLVMKWDYR